MSHLFLLTMSVFGRLCSPPTKTSPLFSSAVKETPALHFTSASDNRVLAVTTAPEGSSALVRSPTCAKTKQPDRSSASVR